MGSKRVVRRVWRVLLAGVVALSVTVVLAGCSSSSDDGGPDETGARDTDASVTTTTAAPTTTTGAPPGDSVVDAACDGLLESPETEVVEAAPVVEASGIAVSRTTDGALWVHNDSGDSARVFALDLADGRKLATFRLDGAEATDWEDMALGPDVDDDGEPVDDADALYLADIGDNDAVRQNVTLYRVSEPEVAATGGEAVRATLDDVERYSFQYPDGPRDAESLFIDRTTDSFFIIEKSLDGGPVGIYRGPLAGWNADAAAMPQLERVGTYRPGPTIAAAVTGADMTPAGDALAVRTYGAVHLFARAEGEEIADVLAGTPCDGPVPVEAQGEAVAFLPDGSAYLTLPEGASPTLSRWAP
jgi:hypothetical protein